MRSWSMAMAGDGGDPHLARYRRRWLVGFWTVWAAFMLFGFVVSRPFAARSPASYRSSIEIAGLPLLAYGPEARGIVAVGGVAIGLVAGGGVAIGGIALSGLALGGLALGGYAYAGGGVALGYHEASGAQRERLLATR
jgi:hypothetical protein